MNKSAVDPIPAFPCEGKGKWLETRVLMFVLCAGCSGTSPVGEANAAPDVSDEVQIPEPSTPHKAQDKPKEVETENQVLEPRTIRFAWCPKKTVADAYEMSDPADQHRIVLTGGVVKDGSYPVVVGFHGQPKRGKDPGDYGFPATVGDLVVKMVKDGEIGPVILVLPVFRFVGGNWPWFSPRAFRAKVEELLAAEGLEGTEWFAFGHSGAAGCGGAGLNQAHLMRPVAVGFFDTCLGKGWIEEIAHLEKAGIRTLNVHSVETAGFKPRQRPEYQSNFDFGRAYGPAGMKPVSCPAVHPGAALRDQEFRCARSESGLTEGFVVDSGEGVDAHRAIVEPAVRFFLAEFASL